MKRLLIVAVVLALSGPVAAAEFDLPPGKWWENPRVVENIGLTEDQQGEIREIVYDHARRMIDIKADVDRSGLDLREAVEKDDFSADEVRSAYGAFQKARQRLENERFEMLVAVRQILTTEQWKSLLEVRRRLQDQRGGQRRPGQRGQGGQYPQSQAPPPGQRY